MYALVLDTQFWTHRIYHSLAVVPHHFSFSFLPVLLPHSFQRGCQAIYRLENNESNSSSEQTLLEYLNEINDAGENTGSLTYWSCECHVELSLRRMIPSCHPAVLPSCLPGTLPWTSSPCRSWDSKPISPASGQNQLKSRYSFWINFQKLTRGWRWRIGATTASPTKQTWLHLGCKCTSQRSYTGYVIPLNWTIVFKPSFFIF